MYQTPIATGIGAATGVGAVGSIVAPQISGPPTGSDAVIGSAHQVLAFTGFAFGAYLVVAMVLILSGLIIRKLATYRSN